MGVGEAIGFLGNWIAEQGYTQGDACFALSYENAPRPPFIEYVYIKIEEWQSFSGRNEFEQGGSQ